MLVWYEVSYVTNYVKLIRYQQEVSKIETLRVSGSSRPNSVAGAVAALLRSEGAVDVQAIGAQAVNQAVKAIAIARSYLEEDDLDLNIQPSFVKLMLQDDERTAIKLRVTAISGSQNASEVDESTSLESNPEDTN